MYSFWQLSNLAKNEIGEQSQSCIIVYSVCHANYHEMSNAVLKRNMSSLDTFFGFEISDLHASLLYFLSYMWDFRMSGIERIAYRIKQKNIVLGEYFYNVSHFRLVCLMRNDQNEIPYDKYQSNMSNWIMRGAFLLIFRNSVEAPRIRKNGLIKQIVFNKMHYLKKSKMHLCILLASFSQPC